MSRTFVASCVIMAGALVTTLPHAYAEQDNLTKTLQEMVTELTPAQQEGLMLLLSGMTAPEAPQSAKEALVETLAQFSKMGEDGEADLAPFYARLSEDFRHWAVGGKAGAVNWFESMKSGLFRDGKPLIEFDLDATEVEEDGDTATAYPVDIFTPLGSVALELVAKREADGVWRVVGIDGL